jgi:hypothetical protein
VLKISRSGRSTQCYKSVSWHLMMHFFLSLMRCWIHSGFLFKSRHFVAIISHHLFWLHNIRAQSHKCSQFPFTSHVTVHFERSYWSNELFRWYIVDIFPWLKYGGGKSWNCQFMLTVVVKKSLLTETMWYVEILAVLPQAWISSIMQDLHYSDSEIWTLFSPIKRVPLETTSLRKTARTTHGESYRKVVNG